MIAPSRSGLALLAVLTAGAVVLAPRGAHAVSPAAELLFQEGRQLMADGQLAEACGRFAASYAEEASSGTLLNLALCNEKLGKPATALAQYRETVRLAQDQGREDRVRAATERAAALELTVPRITVTAATALPKLMTATDDGAPRDGVFDVPVPIDPGPHRISASAPGYRPWSIRIDVADGERRTVQIPPLEAEPEPPAAMAVAAAAPIEAPPRPRSKVDLYVAGGGGLLFIAGGVIWSVAVARFQSAQDTCNTFPGCTPVERETRVLTIERLELAAFGTWLAGGALLVGAAVHHFSGKSSPTTVGATPTAGGGAALSFGGTF